MSMHTGLAYQRLSYKLDPNGELVAEDRDGLARQNRDLELLAARFDAHIDEVFTEDDTSASKARSDKTDWAKLIIAIRERRPTFIFAAAVDRLTRNFGEAQDFEDACKAAGTTAVTVREGEIDFDSMLWTSAVAQARQESINTRGRVKRGQEGRRAVGKDGGGGPRPFGYAADKMTLIPAEVTIIEEIHRRILAGETANAVAIDLRDRKVPTTKKGTQWSPTFVRNICRNPRYAGRLIHKGEDIGKAAWPAIIDAKRHKALLAALETTAQPRTGPPVKSLLGGILRCQCGQSMTATSSGRLKTPTYRCSGGRGRYGCGKVSRGRQAVEAFVVEQLLTNVDDTVIEQERRAIQEQLAPMEDESIRLDTEIAELEDLYKARDIDALHELLKGRKYIDAWDSLTRRRAKLDKEMTELQRQWSALRSGSNAVVRWESWTPEEKRAFVLSRVEFIVKHPSKGNAYTGHGLDRPIAEGEVVIVWAGSLSKYIDPDYVDPAQTARELAA